MSQPLKQFSGPLALEFDRFTTIMSGLGKYDDHFWLMGRLDKFLIDRHPHAEALTKEILTEWFDTFSHLNPVTQRGYRSAIFLLCKFLRGLNPETSGREQFATIRKPIFRPYVFSKEEVNKLLSETRMIRPMPKDPLRPRTFELVVALLFACGLRISEVISLDIGDYDPREGVLKIRRTKFGKTRLVPASTSMRRMIDDYLKRRNEIDVPTNPESALIWSPYNGRPSREFMKIALMRLMRKAGIKPPHGRCGPRVHDLRHSFAVHRLLQWYQEGRDVPLLMPSLSTYLGHINIQSTQHYLQYMPEVLTEASRRFENSFSAAEVRT
jgi:integrase/recombinase XerD